MKVRIPRRLNEEQQERLLSIWEGTGRKRPRRYWIAYHLRRRYAIRCALKWFLAYHLEHDLPKNTVIWSDD